MRAFQFISLAVLTLALSACVIRSEIPEQVEFSPVYLKSTPFFAQQKYQCGPAALATLLAASGIEITPEQLIPRVYVPEKKGSLQIEMIAATREYNRIPYLIKPALSDLISELHLARPVLVFQNLGFSFKPFWHYAVVIGYDPEADEVILRSGLEPDHRLSVNKFMRSWHKAGYWAFVALKAAELPADPVFDRYAKTVADMEQITGPEFMLGVYKNMIAHFPGQPIAQFGLANSYYKLGEYAHAVESYKRVLTQQSDHIAARNNLALALSALGCHDQALAQAREALRLSVSTARFEAQARDSLKRISESEKSATSENQSAQCRL